VTDALPSPFPPESVIRRRLPNGLTVLVRRDSSAPVVAIVTWVRAGYFDETDDVVGIAHVLEHMFFKGTPDRGVGEIARQTKAAGGYLNAATIYDHTVYYTVLPASGFARGLEIQHDAYANSLIDADELRRELEVIIEEARRKEDTPGAVLVETLNEVLHDQHRIRRWRIGREAGLRALTRQQLLSFYRNFYRPGNTVLSIVGDIDPDEALAQVEARYGTLEAGEPHRTPGPHEHGAPGFRHREWSGDITRTHLAMGWRVPGTLHPDAPVLDMLSLTLGGGRASRLYRAVRERGLASSVGAYNYTPTETGVFVIHAETDPDGALDAARAIADQVQRVRDGDIGQFEVERARRLVESQWLRRFEDMDGQANYLAEWEALGDWRLGERYLAGMMAATPDDITRVARQWLPDVDMAVTIYRPHDAAPAAPDSDTLRELLRTGGAEPLPPAPPVAARPSPAARTRPRLEQVVADVHVFRMETGVPILVRRKPGAPLVHLAVHIPGGAGAESAGQSGTSWLLTHAALKGTATRTATQLAEESEMAGGRIVGGASPDSMAWSMSVPASRAAVAVELLADVVQSPVFTDATVEPERTVALAQAAAARDDMHRHPVRLALRGAFAGHSYALPVGGTEESLPTITPASLQRWHADHVLHAPSAIGIVGDGDPAELAALVAAGFGTLRHQPAVAPPLPQWPFTAMRTAEQRDRAQTALALLFPGPAATSPDRWALELLGGIASGLGGRFFESLRDRQSLCYTVQAHHMTRWVSGAFLCYIATSPDREEEARAGLLAEVARFRDEPVTVEELERARTYAIGTRQIARQGAAEVLGEMLDAWSFASLEELQQQESLLRQVTAADIQRVAVQWLDASRVVEGIVRGTTHVAAPRAP
jgi:zinc protease